MEPTHWLRDRVGPGDCGLPDRPEDLRYNDRVTSHKGARGRRSGYQYARRGRLQSGRLTGCLLSSKSWASFWIYRDYLEARRLDDLSSPILADVAVAGGSDEHQAGVLTRFPAAALYDLHEEVVDELEGAVRQSSANQGTGYRGWAAVRHADGAIVDQREARRVAELRRKGNIHRPIAAVALRHGSAGRQRNGHH